MPYKDPAKKRQREAERRILRRDEINAQKREYYSNNKQKILQKNKNYRSSHIEQILKQRADYRDNNRQLLRESAKKFYHQNTDLIKQRQANWRYALKLEILEHYGGQRCSLCDEIRLGTLVIDHIAGGGCQHRRIVGSDNVFYRWLKKQGFPPGYRVLCANCNQKAIVGCTKYSQHPRAKESRERYYCIRSTIVQLLGGCCEDCGLDDLIILTIHHKNKDGGQHRTINTIQTYQDIIKGRYPIELVKCCCFSCHFVEHYYYGGNR